MERDEYELKGTRFYIEALPALDGWNLMEYIRKALADKGGAEIVDSIAAMAAAVAVSGGKQMELSQEAMKDALGKLIDAILRLDIEQVVEIRGRVFSGIKFQNAMAQTPQVLKGLEPTGFKGLPPVTVYELIVRGLSVNFRESLDSLGSRFEIGGLATPPSPQEESPPASLP